MAPSEDKGIILWIRKTHALADKLMVPPSEVYSTLIERGYADVRKRNTIPVDLSVRFIASLFRPEEVLSFADLTARFVKYNKEIQTNDPYQYLRTMISRNTGEKGKRRFRKVAKGYRLNLSTPELRMAIVEELGRQQRPVGSRRLQEMFDVSYERLLEALAPLQKQGKVSSSHNEETKGRDWYLLEPL